MTTDSSITKSLQIRLSLIWVFQEKFTVELHHCFLYHRLEFTCKFKSVFNGEWKISSTDPVRSAPSETDWWGNNEIFTMSSLNIHQWSQSSSAHGPIWNWCSQVSNLEMPSKLEEASDNCWPMELGEKIDLLT